MGLETGVNFIDDLVATNPLAGDDPSEGDDHIRAIKTAVQGSFTSLGSAAVTATAAELNQLDAVTVGGTSSGDIVDLDTAQTLATKDLTTPTINSVPAYGMVILDAPETLVLSTSSTGAWTQYDMSGGGTEAAAAAAAGATKAVLRCYTECISSSGTGLSTMYIEKNGLSASLSNGIRAAQVHTEGASGDGGSDSNDIIVNLDAGSDFEYYTADTTTASRAYIISLIGYYV